MNSETSPKRAIVVGSAGQDGSLLLELLTSRGYAFVGLARNAVRAHGIEWTQPVDIGNPLEVAALVRAMAPHEIYYLAAFHHSAQDAPMDPALLFSESNAVNVSGLYHCLESVRKHAPDARIFYAASSHVFGEPTAPFQDESTPLRPNSIYSMTKTYGMHLCRYYREALGVYASVGILYNHESPRRSPQFLSKKIVSTAVSIHRKEANRLALGSLSTRADWGYAPEYVEAMTRILSLPGGDDFVVATGVSHSVEDFVATAFAELGLDWRAYTFEEPGLLARKNLPLIGNAAKLERATGWRAEVGFTQMVKRLVEAERAMRP